MPNRGVAESQARQEAQREQRHLEQKMSCLIQQLKDGKSASIAQIIETCYRKCYRKLVKLPPKSTQLFKADLLTFGFSHFGPHLVGHKRLTTFSSRSFGQLSQGFLVELP